MDFGEGFSRLQPIVEAPTFRWGWRTHFLVFLVELDRVCLGFINGILVEHLGHPGRTFAAELIEEDLRPLVGFLGPHDLLERQAYVLSS